jgi:glycosyltransferase involved in cell wall biosynthesis
MMHPSSGNLTILIPCFNQGPFLSQCIDSVLSQATRPYQVIVSDNHSSDETQLVLKGYSDFITVVRPREFLPVAAAHFNYLLSLAASPWISFVCADDWIKPNYTTVLEKLIRRAPHASIARAGWHCVDSKGIVFRTSRLLSVPRYSAAPSNFFESIAGPKSPMIGWAANLQKFRRVGFFDTAVSISDWTAMIALSDMGPFVTSHRAIAYYRLNYRAGLRQKRIQKQLEDCFYIAYNYLIPRYFNYSHNRLIRRTHLFLKLLSGMILEYHSLNGFDPFYLSMLDRMRGLVSIFHDRRYIRRAPAEFLSRLPGA